MILNEFELDIDLKRDNYIDTPIIRQNDDAFFRINIYDEDVPYDITEVVTITLSVTRNDGNTVISKGEQEDVNQAVFTLPRASVAIVGKMDAIVQMYDKYNRVSTFSFPIEVVSDPSDYIPKDEEKTLIEIILGEGPKVIEEAKQATQEAKDASQEALDASEVALESIAGVEGALVDMESVKNATEAERLSTKEEREATEVVRQETESLRDELGILKDETESVRQATEEERLATKGEREATEVVRQESESLIGDMSTLKTEVEQLKVETETIKDDTVIAKNEVEQATQLSSEATGLATVAAEYANAQGQRAEAAADAIGDLLADGAVASVNGKTGVVTLDAEDVGAETPQGAQEKVDAHSNKMIYQEAVHGMLFDEGVFTVFDGENWVEIKGGGGGSSIKVGNVFNLSIEAKVGRAIELSWEDPSDVILEGITLAEWEGTIVRRKEGTYPLDENDGELVINNKTRNQFEEYPYVDENLTEGVTYYYMLFPYTESVVTVDSANRVSAKAIEKFPQEPPSTPITSDILLNKATVYSSEGSVVSLNGDEWFSSPHTFEGLVTDEEYTPKAKYEETEEYAESPIVEGTPFTAINKTEQNPPSTVTVSNIKSDEATVTSDLNAVVSLDETTWHPNPHTFSGLDAETQYTVYAKFEENSTQIESSVISKTFETSAAFKNYGVRIDEDNPDPSGAVTYIADAAGFNPLQVDMETGQVDYGSWEDTFLIQGIKVVMLKDGEVIYELDPNDYTKKKDGVDADTTSGIDGDVMVGFPLMYWKFERTGSYLDVYISDAKVDSNYVCFAHTRDGVIQDDYVYISAYKAHEISGRLRSLKGKIPTGNKTIGDNRTSARANGDGYEQFTYYQMLLLQVMSLVITKSRDSQSSLGIGYTNGNTTYMATGITDKKGLFYGESTGKLQMKAFGIEDFYGNFYDWIDGFATDGNRKLLISDANFDDTGSGYNIFEDGFSSDQNGYISKVYGGNSSGFIGSQYSGSSTTRYPDFCYLFASRVAYFGGNRSMSDSGARAGAFYFQASSSASNRYTSICARCSFLKQLD